MINVRKKRQMNWIGHTLRENSLLMTVFRGRIDGKTLPEYQKYDVEVNGYRMQTWLYRN